jgi:hypothetical protein
MEQGMINQEEDKMNAKKMLFAALAAALVAGACGTSWPPEPAASGGKLTVRFGAQGEAARTVLPVFGDFARYEMKVENTGGGASHDPVDITSGGTVLLEPGIYTVTVTGYTPEGAAAARGSAEGVEIAEGGERAVSITLGPISGGADGTFRYDITVPAGLDSARLLISTREGAALPGGTRALSAGGNTDTVSLAPGEYSLGVELEKGGLSAGFRNEALHIYTGLCSELPARTYGEGDFSIAPVTVTALYLTGLCPAPVGGAAPVNAIRAAGGQYTGRITWKAGSAEHSGPFAAGTVYSAELELTAAEGYTFAGIGENVFFHDNAASVTNTANSGNVRIVFFEAEEGFDGGPVSAAKLAAYLASLPQGTAEAPNVVVLEPFIVNSGIWGTTIKDALAGSAKYISLDLSACTASSNTIAGTSVPMEGNGFNVIRKDYIVGLVLPATLEKIDSYACYGFSNLRGVTIPASVTSINGSVFNNCTSLTRVTFEGNSTTIKSGSFSGNFYTVYGAADPKTGTYTRDGSTWTKQAD